MNTQKIKDYCNGIKLLCEVIEHKKAIGLNSGSFEDALEGLVTELNKLVFSESEDDN